MEVTQIFLQWQGPWRTRGGFRGCICLASFHIVYILDGLYKTSALPGFMSPPLAPWARHASSLPPWRWSTTDGLLQRGKGWEGEHNGRGLWGAVDALQIRCTTSKCLIPLPPPHPTYPRPPHQPHLVPHRIETLFVVFELERMSVGLNVPGLYASPVCLTRSCRCPTGYVAKHPIEAVLGKQGSGAAAGG